ncbi:MAG: SMC-Scp complex subunit ScpB, partial [Propionibacterium sp.]|nr:SMC-Scp complex subunit ScpB [Propionibacterium sp.]
NVDGVVRTLLSRGLVDERGSDAQTGAGLLVTTDYFLSRLGLSALSDLPDIAPLLPDAAALEAELTSLAAPAGSDASSQATNEAAPRDRPDDGGRDEVPQEGSHTNG